MNGFNIWPKVTLRGAWAGILGIGNGALAAYIVRTSLFRESVGKDTDGGSWWFEMLAFVIVSSWLLSLSFVYFCLVRWSDPKSLKEAPETASAADS